MLAACLKGNSDIDSHYRRGGWDEIGYFPLTLLTSLGVHERHYEFIGSGEPNELPSPGIRMSWESLILNVLFLQGHFLDRLPILSAPLRLTSTYILHRQSTFSTVPRSHTSFAVPEPQFIPNLMLSFP